MTDGPIEQVACVGLDAGWIAANVAVDGQSPSSAHFDGFIGTGQMSRNARFSLDWGDSAGPPTVVVKLPSSEPGTRSMSFEHGAYLKECDFYRSIAPLVDVVAPASLAVHFDLEAQDFAIVLEDLAGSEQGDQFTEPTEAQLELAIVQAAALQAPVWGQVEGPAFEALHDRQNERGDMLAMLLPMFMPTVFERLGAGLDPDVVDLLERFPGVAKDWALSREPTTLVHGDFRPDNFMYGVAPDAPPIAVVDWQTLSVGPGVTDVAYLLGAAIAPERRREIEGDMLRRYVDELASRGVDYGIEECESDYAAGSLHGIVVAVLATSMADQTERGDALFTLMLNRHGRHALDVEVLERFESS